MTRRKPYDSSQVPSPWKGRYRVVPGNRSEFHLRHLDGRLWPVALLVDDEEEITFPAVDGPPAHALVAAVCAGQRAARRQLGGAFSINECGQILVPAGRWDDFSAYYVGELEEGLLFENPDTGARTRLGPPAGIQPGDRWPLPYVGIIYNLSKRNEIYAWRQGSEEEWKESAPGNGAREIVVALRKIRGRGAVRFLVNCRGVVLTRRPDKDWSFGPEDETWEPVYVGKITRRDWFAKEEA